MSEPTIQNFHAHIYYDPAISRDRASAVRDQIAAAFPDVLGLDRVSFAIEQGAKAIPAMDHDDAVVIGCDSVLALDGEPLPLKDAMVWKQGTGERKLVVFAPGTMELLRSPSLKVVSKPGESERDFRVRLQESTRQDRDRAGEALRQKYAPKVAALQERRRRAGHRADERFAMCSTFKLLASAAILSRDAASAPSARHC